MGDNATEEGVDVGEGGDADIGGNEATREIPWDENSSSSDSSYEDDSNDVVSFNGDYVECPARPAEFKLLSGTADSEAAPAGQPCGSAVSGTTEGENMPAGQPCGSAACTGGGAKEEASQPHWPPSRAGSAGGSSRERGRGQSSSSTSTPSNRCHTSTHMMPISRPRERGSVKICQRVLVTELGM